ncbi:LamG domain-containing protein [Candidatus Woesearchaeota archaeon]|nr:LamG domain-containing protein [Candidatus Woesearchaeota archaeon]
MKQKILWLVIFVLGIVLFVQANSNEQQVEGETVDTPLITGDVLFQENESNLSDIILPPEQPDENATQTENKTEEQIVDEEPIIDDTEENITSEDEQQDQNIPQEDPFKDLRPSLPGPKPKENNLGPQAEGEKGELWERSCDGTLCAHTIYSYQKYYQNNGSWKQIDENFYSTPCTTGYDFCVTDNLYQTYMNVYPDTTTPVFIARNRLTVKFKPNVIDFKANQQRQTIGTVRHSPAQVYNHSVQYLGAFHDAIDLQFKYLPRMFKEEIVLKKRDILSLANVSQNKREITLDIESRLDVDASVDILVDGIVWDKLSLRETRNAITITNGETSLYLAPPIVYDQRDSALSLNYTLENSVNGYLLTIKVPYEWLINESRRYPVYIDPTITLDYNAIIWDGHVFYDDGILCPEPPFECNNPDRNGGDSRVFVGSSDNSPAIGFTTYRGDIDWNIDSIPDHAKVVNINLSLYFEQVDSNNAEMRFYHMEGSNNYYPDNDSGNTGFYNDISNGTLYLTQQATEGIANTFNLTTSAQLKTDFEFLLTNGTDEWSIGVRSSEPADEGSIVNASLFTSAEGTQNQRPSLEVIYTSTKPVINVLTPANASVFDKLGNIIIQVNVTDPDNDPLKVSIFGSNISLPNQPDLGDLLLKQENVTSGSVLTYNWTVFVTDASPKTVVLFHYDNQSELGENDTQVTDFSGATNHASCTGTSCPLFNETGGKLAGAFDYERGDNDIFIVRPSSTFTSLRNGTFATWMYVNNIPQDGNSLGIFEIYDNPNDRLSYEVGNDGGLFIVNNADGSNSFVFSYPNAIIAGTWYHVAFTFGDEGLKSYLNGQLLNMSTTQTVGFDNITSSANISIGALEVVATNGFNGTIDETVIYNYALSQEEIMNLYRLQSGSYYFWVNVTDGITDEQSDNITFTLFADEFEGRKAIERGIRNVTATAPVFMDSQVHTGDTSNNQQLGRFDTFTQNDKQNYAFNYITEGETYMNMNNFDSNIYFLEIINLTGDSITEQVSSFISVRH